ncbi:hypothetical protein BpHYR1_002716 [Brachionus plicatilis]|uniref:Uncharacterized protein n=1 Tax=Brachionus plicatilis TaxID=10195 RepID=A0A3M7QIG0_BRAPC|nr:hypothetical protein BpHYR1_002716 [Brachionus plicatilis]
MPFLAKEEYRICIENLPLYLFCSKVYRFGELKNLIDKSNIAKLSTDFFYITIVSKSLKKISNVNYIAKK